MPYTLKLKHNFDAAHKLPEGRCANLHGHRWEVEVIIETDRLAGDMVVDFDFLRSIVDELDHTYLNELVDFNPTAENLARYLKERIDRETGFISVVTIWESAGASVTYK